MPGPYILALDQGTTSSRAIVFDRDFAVRGAGQREFTQHFPKAGWVEHAPDDIWETTLASAKAALGAAAVQADEIAAIGVTNQRETTLVWDRATGAPIHRAIVWQDRRTAETCAALRAGGHESAVTAKTGLVLDPYFSGTKIAWILDSVPGARERAERGELAFGTVDTWLIWKLTGGRVHATDATNASRTLLLDIATGHWDDELLALFRVPRVLLPDVRDSAGDFGVTEPSLFGRAIPIRGVAGDQQAATVGQACVAPGMMKSTYGTGCFALLVTGDAPVPSRNRLLTTIAWQVGGKRAYALEGAIFIAGAAVQWLRDGLKIISTAAESTALAPTADDTQDVVMVPAFVGLGAPWWDADSRGAIFGLTRGTGPAEIAKAALEAVAFQTNDLLTAMKRDWVGATDTVLRVDGGMAASDWTMQRLADLLDAPVDRPVVTETTALGAAYLAAIGAGVLPGLGALAERWKLDRRFEPAMQAAERARKTALWADAVRRTLSAPAG
jgi:glycerol kinase